MEAIESNSDSESIYMNVEDAEKNSNQTEIYDHVYLNTTTETPGSAGVCDRAAERRKLNARNMAAVGLAFLCVLLLAVITALCIKHDKDMHQIQSSNHNITIESDRLQSSYNIMTMEKNQLVNLNIKLTLERKQLESSYNALKSERDAVQKRLCEIERCPDGWTRFLCSCYLVSSGRKNWEGSRLDCKSFGADLVIINSIEEQKFVTGLGKNVWIGLTDRGQEGQWKWVDDTLLESGYWKQDEPNNAGDEDCVEVQSHVVPVTSNWNDLECRSILHGLCEKKMWCSAQ